jgi:hypothetical protein
VIILKPKTPEEANRLTRAVALGELRRVLEALK